MCIWKLLFQKLQIRPVLAPGRNSQAPGAPLKMYHLGTSGGIQAFVFQGETDDHPPLGMANCPGQECCSFFHPVLAESQSPHCTLFIPHYKKSGLEREEKMVYLGYEPAIFSDRWPSE